VSIHKAAGNSGYSSAFHVANNGMVHKNLKFKKPKVCPLFQQAEELFHPEEFKWIEAFEEKGPQKNM
jgi:hypothetical protein